MCRPSSAASSTRSRSVCMSDSEFPWRPTPEIIEKSQLQRFMAAHGIADLSELHRRSVNDPGWFWDAVLADLQIEFFKPYDKVIDTSPGLPWTRWCVGGDMNIVHNCLDKRVGTAKEHVPAIRWTSEEGTSGVLTYGELSQQVN